MSTKELRRQRAALVEQARELLNKADTEKRDLNSEEQTKYDAIMADVDSHKVRIDREERQASLEVELDASQRDPNRSELRDGAALETATKKVTDTAEYREAFTVYLRTGIQDMSAEQRAVLAKGFERRTAQSATTAAAGGYTVPQGFSGELDIALKQFSSVEGVASGINTSSGNDIPWPTINDTSNKGRLVAESAAATNTELVFGSTTLKAFYFSSDSLLVPFELIEDEDVNLDSVLGQLLGERLGRIRNEYFTTGTGTSQPQGVVTFSTLGATAAAVGAVTYNELIDLQHSVDPAYRANAHYMFNDSTLKVLKKLADSQGRPLWLAGTAVREPDTINGFPYVINQDMATIAASAKSVLFGDFSKYKVRNVKGVQLFRIADKYIETRQVGFVAYMRADGRGINAGTNPVKHLIQAAS